MTDTLLREFEEWINEELKKWEPIKDYTSDMVQMSLILAQTELEQLKKKYNVT